MAIVFHSHVSVLEILVNVGDIGIGADKVIKGRASGLQSSLEVLQRLAARAAAIIRKLQLRVPITSGMLSAEVSRRTAIRLTRHTSKLGGRVLPSGASLEEPVEFIVPMDRE